MIKLVFSKRHKRKMYLLSATPPNGKRFRRMFFRRSDAEAVAYKIKHDAIARRYGLPVMSERPFLSDLIEKRLAAIDNPREHTRAVRVLNGLLNLLPAAICVDELTKSSIQLYVEKRQRDGLKAQSIHRELNIINPMLNQIDLYYPSLEQWRPPKMPRPKVIGGRRERVWSDKEIKLILGELYSPKREDEQRLTTKARYRVGRRVQFCLLNGVRTGEMAKIAKSDIDWEGKTVSILQGKTGNKKSIGPLGPKAMEILKEACTWSTSNYVFFRGTNITPRFYKLLAAACERAGVLYGKNKPGALVLYDARHTATTHLLDDGISPATVKEWMGWSDSRFVTYYSHATLKSKAKAGRSLERLAGQKIA